MTAEPNPPAGEPGAGPAEPARRPRSTKRLFASATLAFEVFVVFFGALVAFGTHAVPVRPLLFGAGTVIVLCLLAAGLLRSRAGYLLGWLVQVLLVAAGFIVPLMFLVGALFGATWAFGMYWGARIDRERAAYEEPAGTPPVE